MKIDTDFAMTINGQMVTTDNTLPVYNPATRSVFAQVPDASREHLDATVVAAREAFNVWSKIPVDERQKAVEHFADLLEENAEELMALLTREQGEPRAGPEWEV
ncbi:MAG: aldehyde dehydrogenase family protein, partial [Halieaceae bacterium]